MGDKCLYRGCLTELNEYNTGKCCFRHQGRYLLEQEKKISDVKAQIAAEKTILREAKRIEKHKRILAKLEKHLKFYKKRIKQFEQPRRIKNNV